MVDENKSKSVMRDVAREITKDMAPEQVREFKIQLGYEIAKGMIRKRGD